MFEKIKYYIKKWLGMAIAYKTTPEESSKNIFIIRENFKIKMKQLTNKDIVNKNNGIVARISRSGVDKISSDKALNKSLENGFEIEEHFKAAENIQELYENSIYIRSEEPKNESPDIVNFHRYSIFFQINNKDAEAWLTLKESIEHGNRIYSLELDKLKPLPQAQAHTKQVQQGQSNLTLLRDVDTQGILSAVEKTDKPNPTTKKQISQEQKKQAHLAREAGIKKSLDLLKKKQSKSADAAVSNISSDSVKNETKPKFRKMFQKKDKDNNKDKK